MISYLEALTKLTQSTQPLGEEKCSLFDALNRIMAETIIAKEPIPSFNNSGMDGFAIRAEETKNVSAQQPLTLQVISSIAAGEHNVCTHCPPYSSIEIMTGASVPDAYNAVIPIEHAILDAENQTVTMHKEIKQHENIRSIGEDFSIGAPIIHKGAVITAQHLMALAATGTVMVHVKKKPRIWVITTGKELIDDYSIPLQPGKIRNANMIYLRTIFTTLGLQVDDYCTVLDEPKTFVQKIKNLMSTGNTPDIIITTGAVSAGKWDFIPSALKMLGADIIFHKVAIKPGKPIIFAKLNKTYILGLPGNPISMVVGVRFFLYPLLCALQQTAVDQPLIARLQADISKPKELRCFYKAVLHIDDGVAKVDILKGQESFKISSLLAANCWAILEENNAHYQASDFIKIYPLHPRHTLGSRQNE